MRTTTTVYRPIDRDLSDEEYISWGSDGTFYLSANGRTQGDIECPFKIGDTIEEGVIAKQIQAHKRYGKWFWRLLVVPKAEETR